LAPVCCAGSLKSIALVLSFGALLAMLAGCAGTIIPMLLREAEPQMSEMWQRWQGQVVNGTFHLRQYLGGSKHSAVFRTEHAELKSQKAAIKLIASDPASAELQLSRWKTAARLFHPHLIALYDMGRCRLADIALLFLVMEYAEENLSEILPQRSLTAAEATAMLSPTLDALAYLHREGFAHGHLKPANIMAVGNQLKLSSDGLWWMAEPSMEVGNTGFYDPPEKSTTGISPAGDVWSLGVTLIESLTQRVPEFQARQQEPTVPETLPAPFFEIARHCLHHDPQQRWTVAEITTRMSAHERAKNKDKDKDKDKVAPARPLESFAQRRIIIPAVVIGLALLAIFAAPRLLKRPSGATSRPRTIATEEHSPAQVLKPSAAQPSQSSAAQKSIPSSPETSAEADADTSSQRVARGGVIHRVVPQVSQSARNTIQGTVRVSVRVRVDSTGKVTAAEFDSAGASRYFARLARRAAEQWKFRPAKDHRGPREWLLQFQFRRNGTKVHSRRLSG
jgi:TonB family protein